MLSVSFLWYENLAGNHSQEGFLLPKGLPGASILVSADQPPNSPLGNQRKSSISNKLALASAPVVMRHRLVINGSSYGPFRQPQSSRSIGLVDNCSDYPICNGRSSTFAAAFRHGKSHLGAKLRFLAQCWPLRFTS